MNAPKSGSKQSKNLDGKNRSNTATESESPKAQKGKPMKREIRNAISKAIKESNLNGYKWTITAEGGLHWSYGVDFEFEGHEDGWLVVKNEHGTFAGVTFGENRWDDCKTIEEAYYLVTKQAIKSANYTY